MPPARRRIVLVTDGPLPTPAQRDARFCALRADQFAAALAHHDVRLVDARLPDDALRALGVDPDRPERLAADAVVSAGIYAPTRLALRLAADRPLWLDLPGDPFADAQAAAWYGDLTPPETRAARVEAVAADAAAVFGPALARADRVSAVSGPSRHALLGMLGLVGRTARTPPGEELVHTIPIAWRFGGLEERAWRPPGPLRILWAGSLNTWFDVDTAWAGVAGAMDVADVELHVTGGGVAGHHVGDAARLAAKVRASPHAARVHLHGWLPEPALAEVVATCNVAVSLDRPGYEPELGSRTRVLFALHQGLRVVATPRTELVRELAAAGFVTVVPPGDPVAVTRALLSDPSPAPDRAPLRARYSVDATTAALRAWADAPGRAAPLPTPKRGWLRRRGG